MVERTEKAEGGVQAGHNELKVKDMKGEETQGKEVVMVWKDHFEGLLNAGQPSKGVGKRQNGTRRVTPYALMKT